MSTTTRRLVSASAIPALALGLAACGSGSDSGSGSEEGDGAARLSPQQAVLASYEGLDGGSYKMESSMTIDGIDFMDMTNVVDGDSSQSSQDMYMSAIMEAMGEDFSDDPETAEMMEAMFADMHTETILVEDVIYMQLSGGMFDAMAEDFGEDAWFTIDLAEGGELGDIYEQFGSFDLAEQTELMLGELSDVEEVGDGVYTGTLNSDSEAMQSLMGATGGAANGAEMIDGTEITVTLDDDGLLKAMQMTLPEIEGMTMVMDSEVVEIGGDYDIAAPETDNLRSFDEFAGMMQ
ncbi:hypothetical protein L0U85_13265 [Glycomyces sp. L485]|uniref:hypothetical protein n=1 Tax=Glycomyces sp. L485 TaxID=2909235 RepID=UPI001F4ADF4D|nr:hypothetical protein [Glycomyces sp. L485]MCH7231814.1 hypothetical protein [Glycomyces sp. L485]